jgi:hypothetical protein
MNQNDRSGITKLILLAGLAGGGAEVLWVTLYSSITGVSGSVVAQQVTASVWPAAAAWPLAPLLGVGIHMALALALAALCAPLLLRVAGDCATPAAITMVAVMALTLVWAINFFLVLPVINPNFVALMPYSATLMSKMLFGIAMAVVIRRMRVQRIGRHNKQE